MHRRCQKRLLGRIAGGRCVLQQWTNDAELLNNDPVLPDGDVAHGTSNVETRAAPTVLLVVGCCGRFNLACSVDENRVPHCVQSAKETAAVVGTVRKSGVGTARRRGSASTSRFVYVAQIRRTHFWHNAAGSCVDLNGAEVLVAIVDVQEEQNNT